MRFGSRQVITAAVTIMLATALEMGQRALAARGESPAAFDGRCIPGGCVAPRSNTPGILGRRALPAGRLARLGATPDFHHGLLTTSAKAAVVRRPASAKASAVRRSFSEGGSFTRRRKACASGVIASVVFFASVAQPFRAASAQQNPNAPQNFIKVTGPVIALTHARVID